MLTQHIATTLAQTLIAAVKTNPDLLIDEEALARLFLTTDIPPKEEDRGNYTNLLFILEPKPLSSHDRMALESLGTAHNMTTEVNEEREHLVIRLFGDNPTLTSLDLHKIGDAISWTLLGMSDINSIGPVKGWLAWKSDDQTPKLSINFEYLDTGQVCTGTVDEYAWEKRANLNVSEDAAFLFLAYDIEIPDYITESHIELGDVFTTFNLYEE